MCNATAVGAIDINLWTFSMHVHLNYICIYTYLGNDFIPFYMSSYLCLFNNVE